MKGFDWRDGAYAEVDMMEGELGLSLIPLHDVEVDINAKNGLGVTVLNLAEVIGQAAVIRLLLNAISRGQHFTWRPGTDVRQQ